MKNTIIVWIRLFGWTILTHILLIGLSVLEVFVYSLTINPNQAQRVYDAHAQAYAPWVAIVFGIPVFYLIARRLVRSNIHHVRTVAFGYPLLYIITDLLLTLPFTVNFQEHAWIFILSYFTKSLSVYWGVKTYRTGSLNKL